MSLASRFVAVVLACLLGACASTPSTPPAEIRVMTSGGFTAAFKELYPLADPSAKLKELEGRSFEDLESDWHAHVKKF